jgi:hypothetical protein
MARIRTIKPEFFTSEDVVGLQPLARLLFIGLWCEADKEGRLAWKPKTFKMRYLPADECDVEALCQALVDRGVVRLYGEGLAHIPTFTTHQHINPRETASALPDPHASPTRAARVIHAATGVDARASDAQGGRKDGKEENDASMTRDFEAGFWLQYPNRKAKADALKAWLKLKPKAELQQTILQAIERQRQGEDWRKDGGRFVPHAATWLNGHRWQDEGGAGAANDVFAGAR